jgi:transcription elongation factor Elf1
LQEHFVEDRNTGKHGCIKCNKQYSGFMELVRHIARQLGNHGKYQCGLCQLEFELQSTELTGVERMFVIHMKFRFQFSFI